MNSTATTKTPTTEIEIIIEPKSRWLHIDWRSVVERRDLLFLLVRRDFVVKYKQTVLGPAWFIIQPLLMTLIFTVIFGNVAKIPTDGLPTVLFYLCGLLGWSYFAQVLSTSGATFTTNADLFTKIYFPRIIVPLAVSISNLFAFAIQLVTFIAFFAYFYFFTAAGETMTLSWSMLLLPFLILHIAVLALGVGFWLSSLTAKYRDFQMLQQFLIQIWMYATPIIWPLSQVPEAWRWAMALNPMAAVIESLKLILLGSGTVTLPFYAFSLFVSLAIFISGLMLFQRTERNFVDTV
jgi:lipopolysaccharide transport system permease protein